MRVVRTFAELTSPARNVCLAIGVFDGVHLGHQRVITQARDEARAMGGSSVVLTFDPHPLSVLKPDKAPPLLTSTAHKLALIERLNVDACLLLTFDKAFSETPAEKFVEQIAFCRQVCVGTRFHFGHNRTGTVALMTALAPRYGFAVKEIKSVLTADGEMISSTAVRNHVLAGHLDRVAAMLGRPFSVLGTVEQGDRVGHGLGFPTANLNPHGELLPPNGVYAVRAQIGAEAFSGVVNIGVRPTFKDRPHQRVLEVHLLDFNREIYGADVEVLFRKKLREEKKFNSRDALKQQIAADVLEARNIAGRQP
jgi:riboflavin kinase / FMN adenylyltransferase